MVDAATQRLNMVESQVLTSDVNDRRILRAMRELPREVFVPAPMAALAYMDEAVPLTPPGPGRRWLLAPRLQAKLLQLAAIDDGYRVLDIGCASGYSSAVLAGMAKRWWRSRATSGWRSRRARTLAALGLDNVDVVVGELRPGGPPRPPSMRSSSRRRAGGARDAVRSVEGRRVPCRHRQPGWLGQSNDLASPGAVS